VIIKINVKKLFVNLLVSGISITLLLVSLELALRARNCLRDAKNGILLVSENKISDKTFNIYYFGGSTMVGEPYTDLVSIPKLVSYMLDFKVLNKDIRYINMAEGGKDFQYTLDKLKFVLKHKNIFYPSLCVIYSGHNEFLKY